MSGWGPSPGGAGHGDWGSPQQPGGGQGGWGGQPQQPSQPQSPYGQQPYGGAPQQDPYAPSGPQQQQSGWGQPAQPQNPYGQQPYGGAPQDPYGQPPPGYGRPDAFGHGGAPPPKKKTGLIIGLVGGGVALLVIIVLVVLVAANGFFGLLGGDTKVSTPEQAGGLKRDHNAEQQLKLDNEKNSLKSLSHNQIKEVLSAVYADGAPSATSQLAGKVLFIGATAKSTIDQDGFINGFKKGVGSSATVTTVDAGDQGGEAACAATTGVQATAECVWVDDSTFGEIAAAGKSSAQVSQLMLKMRKNIEVKA